MKKSESSLIWIWNKRHRHICKKVREALEADTQTLLDQQAESNDSCVLALKKEYESRHTLYAQEILKRITEV